MVVTLTTDFGLSSEGPGIMEATILGIAPGTSVVHLTHSVSPFSILEGARQMECVLTIPPAIHVCVVDPGVGSSRLAVAISVKAAGYFIGPDNGVLIPAVALAGGMIGLESLRTAQCSVNPCLRPFMGVMYLHRPQDIWLRASNLMS